MNKTFGTIAVVGTVLTAITLVLDLPEKVANAYRGVTRTPPAINVNALFMNQEALTVSIVTDDKAKGYSTFVWPAVYELHNTSNQDVTINQINNLLNEIEVGQHTLRLKQVEDKDSIIVLYDTFQSLTANAERGVTERLPYTIKSGTKLYVKVMGNYKIDDKRQPLFCKSEPECYKLLALSLGVAPNKDGAIPCVVKTFKTQMEFAKYRGLTTDQKAILLVPGCKIDLNAIRDKFLIDTKK